MLALGHAVARLYLQGMRIVNMSMSALKLHWQLAVSRPGCVAHLYTCMSQQILPLVLHAHLVRKFLPSSQLD